MNSVAEEVVGSIAVPKSTEGSKRGNDGFVRICGDVIFHLDVLKLTLPKGDASGAPVNAKVKKQMSLDLEDLW
ncbi:hypothetical protein GNZ12_34715 [Paraburkholderia sp. 1N]|uniref:Uncharacterized protein n=1 Tax=Paraburkholderia solitsugae TaxID=2675748 RepID=A0ABX2C3B0_9BURK|nr:hypothetical protein [Paraburkholderia solitsugae]NPT46392.1 hypothetical protein [Paraburkholderia solitsugae]